MRILGLKPGHDGHIAHLIDGVLDFSIEAEKDSGYRYAQVDGLGLADALARLTAPPDVFAVSGWASGMEPRGRPIGAGYMGISGNVQGLSQMNGSPMRYFSSSHERSHILCSYALSPFPQGTPCYALTWEGHIGAFYEIDRGVKVRRLAHIMYGPGIRYAYAYAICDPTFNLPGGHIRLSDAGKLMALAAFEENPTATSEEQDLLARLMANPHETPKFDKNHFRAFSAYNSGVESIPSKRLARLVSNRLLAHFIDGMSRLVEDKRPLLISGGCGLNCDWNRALLDSGVFSDVFVPPCTNDTGSAIGTAVDAQLELTGHAKLEWNVYSGSHFIDDMALQSNRQAGSFARVAGNTATAARLLQAGAILAWVSGRTEIGPRALGNRSLLAEPYRRETQQRLNTIKQREHYRPIAPLCLEEDFALHFDLTRASPHMLYFARVRNDQLKAITHVDGSSRVQTVNPEQNGLMYKLLRAFKEISGAGVLCNTSLNFSGKGFINRASDLVTYADTTGLDGFAVEGALFLRSPEKYTGCL
ncbi:carbamoyltransferase C-terminal domain-containing protein [Paraburkholderia bryophila]|uniref:Hydroxymethyl cephem carbamoyltransferase n=1 Tax=Paraburkholderia bryophila TaxID=420952 RepID=A0A329CUE6_9BURK|nr:carbamoyltransferase C-terminal domain-containing protein [Paraburkholderia bryophila]RAS37452.1 hydroxymethyl cephem carbamoyltransferase [Paraburkholderia bryophila]